MFQIITDSSAEFTAEEAAALGIKIVPLVVIFGDREYAEGENLTKAEFYSRLLAGEFPHTSQPSEEAFTRAFAETNGADTLVILISSALSGTVNTARLAARDGGFTKVRVYDSLCTTAMLRILVETAAQNRDKTVEKAIALLDELRPRLRVCAYVDTLEYLYKGGRLKKSVAIVGNLLGVKPLVTVPADGTVVMSGRAHGKKRAIAELAARLQNDDPDPAYPVYFLCTDREEPARALMQAVHRETDSVFQICCAVGAHIGPNAAGYVCVSRQKKQ